MEEKAPSGIPGDEEVSLLYFLIEPCGAETMRVISAAEKYAAGKHITKGQIWCVYDKDSFPARNFNGVLERAESLNS